MSNLDPPTDPANFGTDDFLLNPVGAPADVRHWSVQASRVYNDVFFDPDHVKVGYVVALNVRLVTEVNTVGGETQFYGPDRNEIIPGTENGGFSDFFATFEGGLISNTKGVEMILLSEKIFENSFEGSED